MKVQIEKAFPLPGPAAAAWAVLQDIEAVAACMPGAKITERIDAQHYKGTVAVKFGPASMAFRGTVEVMLIDPATRSVRLVGKGTDTTGSSGAAMDLTARIEPVDAATCKLLGNSEVAMSGKAAAFGGRMMNAVADQVLKQFADNFAVRVQAQAQAPSAPPGSLADDDADADADAGAAVAAPPAGADTAAAAVPPAAAPAATVPLNGLALAWAVIKAWLRDLFASKRA